MTGDCHYTGGCPIYRHFSLKAIKNFFISRYCQGDFERCKRKKLKDAGKEVPEKLLPNGEYLP